MSSESAQPLTHLTRSALFELLHEIIPLTCRFWTAISVLYPGSPTTGRKAIPDAAHPFQAPPAGAQRGNCPGLDLLANYGYIDRSGITTVGQLLWAMQEALG